MVFFYIINELTVLND